MFPQLNRGKLCLFSSSVSEHPRILKQRYYRTNIKYLLFLSCLVISIINVHPASAHKVEIAADVGATLHIEPNDNPRAGEPTQAWFALTRKGGKTIPLTQCKCRLAVYAEPHSPQEPALLEPSLKPVTAERYQGIPGANIIFPKPGAYQLQLSGSPANTASFKPFKFKFEVTVASGATENSQLVQNVNNAPTQSINTGSLGMIVTALAMILGICILFFLVKAIRRN
ncbi:hypothetical protein [Halotia branconii]|uniref:Uncharacterized protein n=1 Tax=Halotia branconii CENA392 TaxID=1539056 RepID=A0AAJ6P952_9CYAN|nr:hypothetical protein [Halotia branconii]WGV25380.1 hypothetical protein QI031_27155 [Halotia branconii CENA392]